MSAPSTEIQQEQKRSFTGNKLDWMGAVMSDPRLDARAFEIAFCIAQHVNQQTGIAFLSDEVIADKTGIPGRWISRARRALRETGWIGWKRTGRANVYWTLGDNLNAIVDHQIMLKDQRDQRRERVKAVRHVSPPVAHLKCPDVPSVAELEPPPMASREPPPVANIHLSSYTFDITPSKNLPSVEGPLPKIDHPQLAETYLIKELGEGDTERGLDIARAIGDRRFNFLLNELRTGLLYPSSIRASVSQEVLHHEVAA